MESFYAEFSKIIGYSFYIKLDTGNESKILITPSPGVLYMQICSRVYGINLLHPIVSLKDIVYQQENQWIFIKIQIPVPQELELQFKQEFTGSFNCISCGNCSQTLVKGIQKNFPLPSTNWETLSELWSCHPSHEPKYSIDYKSKSSYISLFYIHLRS
jgi:HECT-like Ubiquitin-conjugating enzyme (E2)-binding